MKKGLKIERGHGKGLKKTWKTGLQEKVKTFSMGLDGFMTAWADWVDSSSYIGRYMGGVCGLLVTSIVPGFPAVGLFFNL